MDASRRTRVVIDIERTAGTVGGEIRVGSCAAHSFYGWLDLIDLLSDELSSEPDTVTRDEQQP